MLSQDKREESIDDQYEDCLKQKCKSHDIKQEYITLGTRYDRVYLPCNQNGSVQDIAIDMCTHDDERVFSEKSDLRRISAVFAD